MEIAALPFNPEALLDSLGMAAPHPRPAFPELEQALESYQPSPDRDPEPASPRSVDATKASVATRDSVLRLSAALRRMDRTAPGYHDVYARFRDLYARYSAREASRETELRKLHSGDRSLAQRAARAADSLRMWERTAYRDFPRLAEERAAASGRPARRVTTDSSGVAILDLAGGPWWLSARLPDSGNTFLEYHWNVSLTAAGLPFGVPLTPSTAETRWRH